MVSVVIANCWPGGSDINGVNFANTDAYNPSTNAWSSVAAMKVPHSSHVSIVLQNGKLLVAGGPLIEGILRRVMGPTKIHQALCRGGSVLRKRGGFYTEPAFNA